MRRPRLAAELHAELTTAVSNHDIAPEQAGNALVTATHQHDIAPEQAGILPFR